MAVAESPYFSNLSSNPLTGSVTVMLDRTSYKRKPDKGSHVFAAITHAVAHNRAAVSVRELAQYVTQGCSFAPAVFCGGKRSRQNWVHQQVFALDFDEGATIDGFLQRCHELGIFPSFVCPSFSHTDKAHRFRAVFTCDQIITDIRVRDFLQSLLMRVFATRSWGPDPQCKDAARYFLGTSFPLSFESLDSRINPIAVLQAYRHHVKKHDATHAKSVLEKLAHDLGLAFGPHGFGVELVEYDFDHSIGGNEYGAYTIYTQNVFPPTFPSSFIRWKDMLLALRWEKSHHKFKTPSTRGGRTPGYNEEPHIQGPQLTGDQKKCLLKNCQLVREFMTGETHVRYHGRRILVTNLRQRKGGIAWYKKGLSMRDDYSIDNLIDDAKHYNMKPEGCLNCPYHTECNHKTNLLQQLPVKRRECRQISPSPVGIPVEETRHKLRQAMQQALNANDGKIHVIKCDTGVGKTAILLEHSLEDTCVAFPTHKLKQEAYRRYRKNHPDVNPFLWPERPKLPDEFERILQQGYMLGQPATRGIMKRALDHPDVQRNPDRAESIEHYLQAMQAIHGQRQVFTTHEKAFQLQHIRRFVFDEDLLSSMIRISEVSINDVKTLRSFLLKSPSNEAAELADTLRNVLQAPSLVVQKQQASTYPQRVLHRHMAGLGKKISTPIEALFTSTAFIKDKAAPKSPEAVYCIECQPLLPNATYIVLSATADEWMYKAVFCERVVFEDLSGTERIGKLLLHTQNGFSKSSIAKSPKKFVDRVKADQQDYGFTGVITHKFIQPPLKKAGIKVLATFGALEGLDGFKGQDIAVYGTPHPPEYIYKLYGKLLGLDVDMDHFDFHEAVIQRGEFEFSFPLCSANPTLQQLQLSLITSELEQAVGRARLVNHPCTVRLFSNLPLSGGAQF